MRIIHTRKRTFAYDNAFRNKFSFLVWVLSILKWKEYGNQVVLYADTKSMKEIKKFGLDKLYDEVNETYLNDEEVCKGIDFECYWAMPKLLALRHEVVDLGNDCVIADQDVVPMSDISRMWTNTDIAVWSNKEFVEVRSIYPELWDLSLPSNYTLPKWFTGKAKPFNTGIIHIKNKDIVDMFTNEARLMSIDNHNQHNNTRCQTMCNAEQRMLGEIVKYKGLSYSVMQPINEGLFNKNGFHTHGYKNLINNDNGVNWHCSLLKLIKKSNPSVYNMLLDNEWFKEEKQALANNKYAIVDQLKRYF